MEDVRQFLVFYCCAVWMFVGSGILCEKSQLLKEPPGVTSEIMRSIVKNHGNYQVKKTLVCTYRIHEIFNGEG